MANPTTPSAHKTSRAVRNAGIRATLRFFALQAFCLLVVPAIGSASEVARFAIGAQRGIVRIAADCTAPGRSTVDVQLTNSDGRVLDNQPVAGRSLFVLIATIDSGSRGATLRVATSPAGARIACKSVRLVADRPRESARDVTGGANGLTLGPGWYPLETYAGEQFRWVDNDASIDVDSGIRRVVLRLEPGPGIRTLPMHLAASDGRGRRLLVIDVPRRAEFAIPVPGHGRAGRIVLHVDNGGATIPTDPRILNFRVFEIRAE